MSDSQVKYIKNPKNTVTKVLIALVLVLILAVGLLIAIRILSRPSLEDIEAGILPAWSKEAGDGLLPGYTADEIREAMQKTVDASMFAFKINTTPRFKDGNSNGNLRIENPPSNFFNMDVEVVLDDTGEQIYSSGLLKPNQHIAEAKLFKTLKKGEYKATAYFYAYHPDTNEAMGKAAGAMTIEILS